MGTSALTRTEPRVGQSDEKRECVDRVLASPLLRGSESLCHLLRFLADAALAGDTEAVKEYQIAREVFGRSEDFDPRLDSIARVQASRLRAKLAEYYAGPGAEDPWRVELPRGGYCVTFVRREAVHPPTNAIAIEMRGPVLEARPPLLPHAPARPAASRAPVWLALLGIGVAACLLAYFVYHRGTATVAVPAQSGVRTQLPPRPPAPTPIEVLRSAHPQLANFWTAYSQNPDAPLVIFSSAEFVGRPETGMRRRKAEDPADSIFGGYTGVGELMAVDSFEQLYRQMGRRVLVEQGRMLNWDETRGRDLMFVGALSENLLAKNLPRGRHFVLRSSADPAHRGERSIVNLQPQAGEEPVYFASGTYSVMEDYALIESGPGSGAHPQNMLFAAGTTTYGTQAAADFLCSEDQMAALLKRLDWTNGKIPAFSAVIRVRVQHGVPVDSELVALRPN